MHYHYGHIFFTLFSVAARCHKNRGAPGHGLVSLGLAAAVIKSKLKLKPRAAESGEETKLEKQSQNKNRNKRHQQVQHCTGPLLMVVKKSVIFRQPNNNQECSVYGDC